MVESYFLLGEYSKAIDILKEGIKSSDKDILFSNPYTRIGVLLAAEGKYNESISMLNEGLSKDNPQHSAFNYEYRGILFYKIGKYDKALDDFKKAINNQDNKSGLPFFYSGMIHAEENKRPEALRMFDSAANKNYGFYDLIAHNKRLKQSDRIFLELYSDSLLKYRNPKYSYERLQSILAKDTAQGDDSEVLSERIDAIFAEKDLQKEYRKCYQLHLESADVKK